MLHVDFDVAVAARHPPSAYGAWRARSQPVIQTYMGRHPPLLHRWPLGIVVLLAAVKRQRPATPFAPRKNALDLDAAPMGLGKKVIALAARGHGRIAAPYGLGVFDDDLAILSMVLADFVDVFSPQGMDLSVFVNVFSPQAMHLSVFVNVFSPQAMDLSVFVDVFSQRSMDKTHRSMDGSPSTVRSAHRSIT